MKPRLFALILMLLCSLAAAAADYYKVSGVKRIDQDLYRTSDKLYIETRYCYHYTYGEEAVIKWEGAGSFENKIIWSDDSNCQVKAMFRN